MVVVGLTAGGTAQFNMGLLLRKRLTMVGTVLRARPLEEKDRDGAGLLRARRPNVRRRPIAAGVDRVLPFAEIRDAHELMESNGTFGKIVLRWD